MSIVALTYWMEVALWVVLGAMAVDFLIGLFLSLTGGKIKIEPVLGYLKDITGYVLGLLILAGISAIDTTGWIVVTGYYIGAAAVVVKYLMNIKDKF